MKNLGLICFANESGIGYQTKRLAELLKPERLLVIDSNGFSKNKAQHWEWYENFHGYQVKGFPTDHHLRVFLQGLTHVLTVENPLNYNLTAYAKEMGIKVFIQTNWEFNDFLDKPYLVKPYKFLMPSHWKVKEMKRIFGEDAVEYIPPPINPADFAKVRDINFERSGRRRFLHVVGTLAIHDRNGTLDIIKAMPFTEGNFELVIKSQHPLPPEYITNHANVKYQIGSTSEPENLYEDFDALIFPRRYGGLSLTCNEALMSGLPVIMPDISPNNELLPKKWLVPANQTMSFHTRTLIDVYAVPPQALADKIDALCEVNIAEEKIEAFELGYNTFSNSELRVLYDKLWI